MLLTLVHTELFVQLFYLFSFVFCYYYSFLFILTLLVQCCVCQYFNKEIHDDDDDDDDVDLVVGIATRSPVGQYAARSLSVPLEAVAMNSPYTMRFETAFKDV